MSAELQALIDQATPGATVAPQGQFLVDAVAAPVRLKSNITLDLTNAVLFAQPNNRTSYRVVSVTGCSNVRTIGGKIVGEKDRHIYTADQFPPIPPATVGVLPSDPKEYWRTGGWGHGLVIDGGSKNISVEGMDITGCFGDGAYVSDAYSVLMKRMRSHGNRRNGMSVIQVDTMTVDSCEMTATGETPDGDGIDFECDYDYQFIRNVTVTKSLFHDLKGSGVAFGTNKGKYSNLRVLADNSFDLKTQPIWIAAGTLGTPWWAMILNRTLKPVLGDQYRYWGYPTSWYLP